MGGRARSYSPPPRRPSLRPAFEPAAQDRECLVTLYRSTHGGKTWRNSRGWPTDASFQSSPRVRRSAERRQYVINAATIIVSGTSAGRAPQPAAQPRQFARTSNANPFVHNNPFAGDHVPASVSPPLSPAAEAENTSLRRKSLPPRRIFNNPFDVPAAEDTAQKPPLSPFADTIEVPLASEASLANGGSRNERLILSQAMVKSPERFTRRGINTAARSTMCSPTRFKKNSSALEGFRRQRVEDRGDSNRKGIQGVEWYGVSLGAGHRVTELKLSDNGLAGRLPENLGDLEMMRYLHIGRNCLTGSIGIW